MHWKTILLCAVLFVLYYPLFAYQCSDFEPYSLEDCYRLAIEHSYALQSLEKNREESQLDVRSNKNTFLPNLNFSTNLYTSGNAVDPTNNSFASDRFLGHSFSFSSDYILWDWGRRKIDIQISELTVQSASEAHSAEARRIKLTVLDRYVRIKILENALAILNEEIDISVQLKDAILQRIEVVSRSKRDLLEPVDGIKRY